jgi:hypothetical protein
MSLASFTVYETVWQDGVPAGETIFLLSMTFRPTSFKADAAPYPMGIGDSLIQIFQQD